MDRRIVAPDLIAIEVEAGKELQHPKLVKFLDEFKDEKDENIHYLVFEYIKGEDLFAFLAKNSFEGLKLTLQVINLSRSFQREGSQKSS